MRRNRLPDGISDFKTLIKDDYIYVDKSECIELLENTKSFVFFFRPRRFGKSLFTSVLEYYYGINYKEEFDQLFGNTYIGKNPTNKKNQYYILKFNFTGLKTDSSGDLLESFRTSTLISYETFCANYKLDFDYRKEGEPELNL